MTSWHDLRKNPNDLPELYIDVIVIHKWSRRPAVGHRTDVLLSSNKWVWAMEGDRYRYSDNDENVLAWCEIPKFDGA